MKRLCVRKLCYYRIHHGNVIIINTMMKRLSVYHLGQILRLLINQS